jgi:DNA-binding response OmpR family regulator
MESIKILILDDDDKLRFNFMLYLEDEGFNCRGTDSGLTALQMLKDEPADIAIVDVRLPEMDGEDFILQAHKIYDKMKFFIHTGSAVYSLSEELRNIGMEEDDVIFKPINDMTSLVSKMKAFLVH